MKESISTWLKFDVDLSLILPAIDWGIAMQVTAKGFTLVEMMITVVVMAILLAIAVPAFRDLISSTRLSSQTNDMLADIALARSESARRNQRVTFCASSNGTSCSTTASDWGVGWIIFSDANADALVTAGDDEIIKIRSASSGNNTIVSSGLPSAGLLQFRPSGGVVSAGVFVVCESGHAGTYGRSIAISASGATKLQRGQTCL